MLGCREKTQQKGGDTIIMKKHSWKVSFRDGTEIIVKGSSKRNAENQACVEAGKTHDEIRFVVHFKETPRPHEKTKLRRSSSGGTAYPLRQGF